MSSGSDLPNLFRERTGGEIPVSSAIETNYLERIGKELIPLGGRALVVSQKKKPADAFQLVA